VRHAQLVLLRRAQSGRLACVSRARVRTGLHDGVRSLVQGGVPPGFLIIDDGWQCTDVDEPLRQARPVPDLSCLSGHKTASYPGEVAQVV
jgi:hypothetical protein